MVETIQWTDAGVVMIDQTCLPRKQAFITCRTYLEVAAAIRTMVIRGAPAIGVAAAMGTVCERQQMQVVVSQHHDRVVPESAHPPQRRERCGAAVDQIPDEPEPVTIRRETQPLQESAQLLVTALYVADGIAGHCRIPGIASRNGWMGASKCAPLSASIW